MTQPTLTHLSRAFRTYIALAVAALAAAPAAAQTFEPAAADYAAVGVWDFWEASPFRTGQLKGNAAVVGNPYADSANPSAHVLGVQRSLYGSNLYGARIDLREADRFELTPQTKYVHALIHKPVAGRCLAIGLGRHTTEAWAHQAADVVQFTALAQNDVPAGEWADAVFPVKGAGQIDIHSLVIVFDCESPHRLAQPFVAYLDNIVVNADPEPRLSAKAAAATASKSASGEAIIVRNSQRNGTVTLADGTAISELRHTAGQALRVKSVPERGFTNGGIIVYHGPALSITTTFEPKDFDANGEITLPAEIFDGDVMIEGVMLEEKK